MRRDISQILLGWPHDSGTICARKIVAADGKIFLQLRVDLGVLQMALDGRPDGERFDGHESMLECVRQEVNGREHPQLSDEQQEALGREMLQYYRRRVTLMALAKAAQKAGDSQEADSFYGRAIRDADHNLSILDLLNAHLRGEAWVQEHEQYRPYILMQRATCQAERDLLVRDPDSAIEHIKSGIAAIQAVSQGNRRRPPPAARAFMRELRHLERQIRRKYGRRRTLREELEDAVAAEDFEKAAKLRDLLAEHQARRNA